MDSLLNGCHFLVSGMAESKKASEISVVDAASRDSDRRLDYFLSLTVENIRCFGPKQTLDLSDGRGRPARWTLILGLNGTGKTTLLQLLAGTEFVPRGPDAVEPRMYRYRWESLESLVRDGEATPTTWHVKLATASRLNVTAGPAYDLEFDVLPSAFLWTDDIPSLWCCGYGASRRLGSASLSESETGDGTDTLFFDKADLRNPEEWLLRLDYAASKPSTVQSQQKIRLSQAKEVLLKVLLDIEDIRLTTPTRSRPSPEQSSKLPTVGFRCDS